MLHFNVVKNYTHEGENQMSLKSIAKYRARKTGNSVEEELKWLKAKEEIDYEKLFGANVKINKYGHKIKKF